MTLHFDDCHEYYKVIKTKKGKKYIEADKKTTANNGLGLNAHDACILNLKKNTLLVEFAYLHRIIRFNVMVSVL